MRCERRQMGQSGKRSISAFVAALMCCSSAMAQDADNFAREENIGVLQRPRPDYDPIGIPLGSFLLFPKLTVSAQYDDNIFATQSGDVSDAIFGITPELNLNSQWTNDELNLFALGDFSEYASDGDQNTTDYSAGFNGKADIRESATVDGGFEFDRSTLPRTSELAFLRTLEPESYDHTRGYADAIQTFDWLRLTAGFSRDSYDYTNGVTQTGAPISLQYLNLIQYGATLRADYAIDPNAAVFVSGTRIWKDYGLTRQFNHDATGYEATTGLNFQITSLIDGEVGAGYMTESYAHLSNESVGRYSIHALVNWYPTQLTTVVLQANRSVEQSGVPISPSYIDTTERIEVDHELRRNVILSIFGQHLDAAYQGINRDDHVWTMGASATYLVNRSVGLKLAFARDSQVSTGAQRFINFDVDQVTLSLVLQR